MPDDRFLHPRLGHSEKVFQLTDLEFRVWIQYQLTADDCGVMRASAMTLQAANERFAKMPAKKLDAALTKLVTIGLIHGFTHQKRAYVCQLDWQEWQKVRYPRASVNPQPDAETLARCSAKTQHLFSVQAREHRGAVSVPSPKDSGDVAETDREPTRAGACERPRLTATAEGNGHGGDWQGDWHGEAFMAAFRDHWKTLYGFECSLIIKPLQYSQLQEQMGKIHETQMRAALAAYFATDDPYVAKAKHPLGLFLREPLRFLATAKADTSRQLPTPEPWTCPHPEPKCAIQWRCQQLLDIAAEKAQAAV